MINSSTVSHNYLALQNMHSNDANADNAGVSEADPLRCYSAAALRVSCRRLPHTGRTDEHHSGWSSVYNIGL